MPRSARLVAVGLLALGVVMFRPEAASAHAELARSVPVSGAVLATAPSRADLWFDEDISPQFSSARLVDRSGREVAGVGTRVTPQQITLRLPQLSSGTYAVLWQVMAADDAHTTQGTVVFSVGAVSRSGTSFSDVGGGAGSPGFADVLRRWLGLLALVGLVGALAMAGYVLPRSGARDVQRARRRVLRLAAVCAALGVLMAVADLVAEVHRNARPATSFLHTATDLVGSTRWGHLWVIGSSSMLLAVALLAPFLRRPDGSRATSTHGRTATTIVNVAAVCACVRITTEALNSHAASTHDAAAVIAIGAHIAAACVWLGVLPALALVLGTARQAGASALFLELRTRLGVLLSASVALVLATGLYSAGRQIGTVSSLFTTAYGQALLIKTAIVVLLASVATFNALHAHVDQVPDLIPRRLRVAPGRLTARRVWVEAATGAALLASVGVLIENAPPRTAPPVARVVAHSASATIADLVIAVTADPDVPGSAGFTATIASSERPAPAPVSAVRLQLREANGARSAVVLRRQSGDTYFGTTRLAAAGPAQLTVLVTRGDRVLPARVPWRVAARAQRAAPGQPLAPIVDWLALAVAAAFSTAAAVALRQRRRSPGSERTEDRDPAVPADLGGG